MKTYSTNGNAGAAARVVLGAGAKRDVHFIISPVGDGSRFEWSPIEGAPAVPTVEAKAKVAKPAKVKAAKAPRKVKAKAVKKPVKVKVVKAKRARKPSEGTIGHTKSAQAALALIRRASGVTNEDGAARTGTQIHSWRGLISRLRLEFHIVSERVNKRTVHTGGAPRRKAAAAAEHAAEGAAAQ